MLSTTTAPASTAAGANALLRPPPALNSAISMPANESRVSSATATASPLNVTVFPTLLDEASGRSSATGKSRCSSVAIISVPTAPVAPTTAT